MELGEQLSGIRKTKWTRESLIAFEDKVKDEFIAGNISAPVHLSKGNEDRLIKIFEQIADEDYVFSTWRSHYHALLKGVDPDWLFKDIMNGNSITIQAPLKNFYTSAIVGGISPIAIGVAMGIARSKSGQHVWCFVGDMGSETGVFHESLRYAIGHRLPITFIIEDNGLSITTDTKETWGKVTFRKSIDIDEVENDPLLKDIDIFGALKDSNVVRYEYEREYPHVGAGKWVTF
jgi:pyruvate dehydrogenase E1 component alpha subunit